MASGDNRNAEQSHACLMSVSLDKRPGFSFLLLNTVRLSVLVFMCCVCLGQGIQGAPGLPGIRGKPGPQVSSGFHDQKYVKKLKCEGLYLADWIVIQCCDPIRCDVQLS